MPYSRHLELHYTHKHTLDGISRCFHWVILRCFEQLSPDFTNQKITISYQGRRCFPKALGFNSCRKMAEKVPKRRNYLRALNVFFQFCS